MSEPIQSVQPDAAAADEQIQPVPERFKLKPVPSPALWLFWPSTQAGAWSCFQVPSVPTTTLEPSA